MEKRVVKGADIDRFYLVDRVRIPYDKIDYDKVPTKEEMFTRYANTMMRKNPILRVTLRRGFANKIMKLYKTRMVEDTCISEYKAVIKRFFEIAISKLAEGKVVSLYAMGWLYMEIKDRSYKKKITNWTATKKNKQRLIDEGVTDLKFKDYVVYKINPTYFWLKWHRPLMSDILNKIKFYSLVIPNANSETALGIIFDMIKKYPSLTNNYYYENNENYEY